MLRKDPFVTGEYYHLYNRGIDKRVIFKLQRDYERFIMLLYLANSEESIRLDNLLNLSHKTFGNNGVSHYLDSPYINKNHLTRVVFGCILYLIRDILASMSKSYTYRTIIEPDGKFFHGYVPALSGCHTFGKTLTETKRHLKDAIQVYVESLIEERKTVPTLIEKNRTK